MPKTKKTNQKMRGLCPACFGQYDVNARGKIQRHGWLESGGRRAGEYGNVWHQGGCFGAQGFEPFEISPKGTEAYVVYIFECALRNQMKLDRLALRPDITVMYEYTLATKGRNYRYDTEHRELVLKDGDKIKLQTRDSEYDKMMRTFSYAQEYSKQMKMFQNIADTLREIAEDCIKRIANWKPAKLTPKAPKMGTVHKSNEHRRGYMYGFVTCGAKNAATSEKWSGVTCGRCLKAMQKDLDAKAKKDGEINDGKLLIALLDANPHERLLAKRIKAELDWDTKRFNAAVRRVEREVTSGCSSPSRYSLRRG